MQLLTIFKIIAAIGTLWQSGQEAAYQDNLAKQESKQEKEQSYDNLTTYQAPQLFIYPNLSQVPEEVLLGTPPDEPR
jgi:hypothetical protein